MFPIHDVWSHTKVYLYVMRINTLTCTCHIDSKHNENMIPQKKNENPSSSVPRLVPTFFHKHEYGRDNIIQKQQQYTKLESVTGIIHRSLFIPTHDIYPPFKRLIFIFYLCLALMVLNISKLHFFIPIRFNPSRCTLSVEEAPSINILQEKIRSIL